MTPYCEIQPLPKDSPKLAPLGDQFELLRRAQPV
jgi:hypothetical protein